jgi:poly-gamma-glutamate capsule biosynthesis protein CapA/YwtB (metallophosphatase superfamily)
LLRVVVEVRKSMVYVDGINQVDELLQQARQGDLQAIAAWINQVTLSYGIRALVGVQGPGCLSIALELPAGSQREALLTAKDGLIRFICHRVWAMNSAIIEGLRISAQFRDDAAVAWEQSVRIMTPARRARRAQLQARARTRTASVKRPVSAQKAQINSLRALLISVPAVFAFVCGAVISSMKPPADAIQAAAAPQPAAQVRSNTVNSAVGAVEVAKHEGVIDPTDPTVTLMFGGDVTPTDAFNDVLGNDYAKGFAAMEPYRKVDLAMVNLESTLTTAETPLDKSFNFKADPAAVELLTEGGVDVVTLANNHAMDYQGEGLAETLKTLEKSGIHHLGAGMDLAQARKPKIIDVKGQRVAYLGYYGADLHSATPEEAGTNPALNERIAEDIKAIRDQVDWVVINYHWGEELAEQPADWQRELARFSIDHGADVIVGHHPHVLQGAEIYKGRPIAYSLGNFIFGGNSRSTYDTAVLKVALNPNRQMKVEFLPVEVQEFQPSVAEGDRGGEILQQIADRSSHFEQPMKAEVVLEAARPAVSTPATPEAEPLSEVKPAEVKPAEVKPTEAKPAEDKPVEATPAEATPSKVESLEEGATEPTAPTEPGTLKPDTTETPSPGQSSEPESGTQKPGAEANGEQSNPDLTDPAAPQPAPEPVAQPTLQPAAGSDPQAPSPVFPNGMPSPSVLQVLPDPAPPGPSQKSSTDPFSQGGGFTDSGNSTRWAEQRPFPTQNALQDPGGSPEQAAPAPAVESDASSEASPGPSSSDDSDMLGPKAVVQPYAPQPPAADDSAEYIDPTEPAAGASSTESPQ